MKDIRPYAQMHRIATDEEVERVWRDFWQDIVAPDGMLDTAQVKRELFDFYHMLHNVPKVYDAVTRGKVSKPNVDAEVVIALYEDAVNEACEEYAKERLAKNEQ